MRKAALAYYITSHGFGHAIRSCEVLRQLTMLKPDLDITVVTKVPEWLLEQNIGRKLPVRPASFDVGLYQYDSLRFDLAKTLRMINTIKNDSARIIEEENRFIKENGIEVLVSDIAFLPFVAAASSGVKGIGISNFTWDWIYEEYVKDDPQWQGIVDWARECYSRCSLLLRLPMHGGCMCCLGIEDIPLVARKSSGAPDLVRRSLGMDNSKKLILVSFSELELSNEAFDKIEAIKGVVFLYKKPLHFPPANARKMVESDFSYVDAVAAADAVITKPGYGIVSDCLANGTPVIYTERGTFRECPSLVDEMQRHLTSVHINLNDFLEGNWEEAIKSICALPRKKPQVRIDGAEVAARKILEFL